MTKSCSHLLVTKIILVFQNRVPIINDTRPKPPLFQTRIVRAFGRLFVQKTNRTAPVFETALAFLRFHHFIRILNAEFGSNIDMVHGKSPKHLHVRREYERYKSKEDKTAFVAVRPTFTQIGTLKDVSPGGLGFSYPVTQDQKPLSEETDQVSIDLFVSGNGFYLRDVKCKVAYDMPEEDEPGTSTSDIQFRKCGMVFDKLSEEQKQKLQLFLDNYTSETA